MLILSMFESGTNFGFVDADMKFQSSDEVTLETESFRLIDAPA